MFQAIVISIGLFCVLYPLWRLVLPLRLSRMKTMLFGAVLTLGAFTPIWLPLFFGRHGQDAPRWLLLSAGWMQGTVLFLSALLIGYDVVAFILRRTGLLRQEPSFPAKTVGLGLIAAMCACFAVYEAVRVPSVQYETLRIADLPPELEGVRIAHLSDLHISRLFPGAWVKAVVERTNQERPDLTVLTGDFVDGSVLARGEDVKMLGELRAPFGVFASTGNHEVYSGLNDWVDLLKSTKMTLLRNEHRTVMINGLPVVIAGLTDRTEQRLGLSGPDPALALGGAPKDGFVVVLQHRPDDTPAPEARVQFSGHTHGGQIILFNKIVQNMNKGFLSGQTFRGPTTVYVNKGAGLWPGAPFRLFVPSEIAILTLTKQ